MAIRFRYVFDMQQDGDGYDCRSFDEAKSHALKELSEWVRGEIASWPKDADGIPCPTPEQKEAFDIMIDDCNVRVEELVAVDEEGNREYVERWSPSLDDLEAIGWCRWDDIRKKTYPGLS